MNGHEPSGRVPRDRKYNAIKLRLTIADMAINIILISIWAFSGISAAAVEVISRCVANDYLAFLAFMAAAGIVYSIIDFPLGFYGGFVVEHKFGLSNQTLKAWIAERAKSAGVGACIGVPVTIAFYFFLKAAGSLWWIYFGAFVFFISVILARIAPAVIYPIFYKFRKIDSKEIRDAITLLLKKQGVQFRGIYTFNMSKDTKKANAGFTGMGKGKRIILSDTLVENFTTAEIRSVFAHEMGHYRKRHILMGIILSTVIIFFSLFLCGEAYRLTLARFGFGHVYDIAAVPILFFYLAVAGLVTMPLSNAVSRQHEREADRFALELTGDADSFISTMNKLADMNLADRQPNPVEEFLFHSHPSIRKRIAFAQSWRR
jgi:STE24 endopeptidase